MKRIIKLFTTTALLLGIVLTSCQAPQKKSTLDKIKETGEITVATSGNQFPFSFKDGDQLKGIDVVLAQVLAEKMGVKAKFVEVELGDIIETVKSGKADIAISGLSITAKRNLDVLFAGPYFETGKAILSNSQELQTGRAAFVNKSDVKIAVVEGSSSETYAKTHYPDATLVTFEGLEDCKDAVYSSQVNAMLADYEICESYYYDAQNDGSFGFKMVSSPDEQELIGIAVNGDDFHLQNLIDNLIKHIKKGKVEEVVEETWLEHLN